MSARHRRPVPPRRVSRRLIGAGAAGLSAAFALAPLAAADPVPPVDPTSSSATAPEDVATPSTETPSTDTPSTDTPSSDSPSSDAPSSGAPSSGTPSTDTPSSDTPTSDAPSSPSSPATSSAPAGDGSATKTPVAPRIAAEPLAGDFGIQKFRVGVQIKTGAYVPAGTTTMGSVIRVVETQADGTVDLDSTCTTVTADTTVPTTTYCDIVPGFNGSDTITLTQLSAPAGLTVDPTPQQAPPCTDSISVGGIGGFCSGSDKIFTDNGLAPQASDDADDVRTGGTVDIPALANDDLHGAPLTGFQITSAPQHGTATVIGGPAPLVRAAAAAAAPATPVIRYVPAAGYVGPDTLRYTITTANGSATGTVSITVLAPPPTAAADRATTTEGSPVTIDVTANDDARGGGTLRIASVGDPAHGTARRSGTGVVYTPAAGFVGTDRFTYTVATDSGTATATVTVTVRRAVTASPTPTPTDSGSSGVANTGTDAAGLLTVAGGLLLAGGAATAAGGRRPRRRAH